MELKPYTILKDKYYRLAKQNKTTEKPAFILGAGTSLYDWMQDPLRHEINRHVVITVNSSILAVDWSQGEPWHRYWISNDALCRKWGYWQKVKDAKAIKIVRDSWKNYFGDIPDFLQFSPRPTSEDFCAEEDEGLAYCSSVPSAIDLAIQMGCAKIYLLGVDHCMVDGKSHFWQRFPKEEWPNGWLTLQTPKAKQEEVFKKYNSMAFEALFDLAQRKMVEIVNCSPISTISTFPKIPFNSVIGKL